MNPRISVGIRFHDLSRLFLLDRCLLSIASQENVCCDIYIATQNFDESSLSVVQILADRALRIAPEFTFQIINLPNPHGSDLRSSLLNSIVNLHYNNKRSDFLAFIDYDDMWFSNALHVLFSSLCHGQFAMAFADVHIADVVLARGNEVHVNQIIDFYNISKKSKSALLVGNFLPLHSYMFSTKVLPSEYLQFDAEMDLLEDYDVLVRVAKAFPVSNLARNKLIGVYNFYTDLRTTANPIKNTMTNTFDTKYGKESEIDLRTSNAMSCIMSKHAGTEWKCFYGEDILLPICQES